jgi:hypothetical protein
MSNDCWKFIFASVVGTSHLATATPCQDSSFCEIVTGEGGAEVLIAVVADGAGSAKHADEGAALACSYIGGRAKSTIEAETLLCEITHDVVRNWIADYQNEVLALCNGGLVPRDFASTLLAAFIGKSASVFFQLGDGAIVIADSEEPNNYGWVFWPQQGQYANQTNFATDENSADNIEYSLVSRRIDEVSLFTDGLQSLALEYQDRLAHGPFFASVFEWVRKASKQQFDRYTDSLKQFLNSDRVNDRTDDDKTIIIATRRPIETADQSAPPDHEDRSSPSL